GKKYLVSDPAFFDADASRFFHAQLHHEVASENGFCKRLRRTSGSVRGEFVVQGVSASDEDPELFIRLEVQEVLHRLLEFFDNKEKATQAIVLIGSKGC